jgi:hypothetical protein
MTKVFMHIESGEIFLFSTYADLMFSFVLENRLGQTMYSNSLEFIFSDPLFFEIGDF